jgi:hypothetical protein
MFIREIADVIIQDWGPLRRSHQRIFSLQVQGRRHLPSRIGIQLAKHFMHRAFSRVKSPALERCRVGGPSVLGHSRHGGGERVVSLARHGAEHGRAQQHRFSRLRQHHAEEAGVSSTTQAIPIRRLCALNAAANVGSSPERDMRRVEA